MLTKGAIGNLINRYRAVLKKCNLINTFGSLAVASMLVMGCAGVAEAKIESGATHIGWEDLKQEIDRAMWSDGEPVDVVQIYDDLIGQGKHIIFGGSMINTKDYTSSYKDGIPPTDYDGDGQYDSYRYIDKTSINVSADPDNTDSQWLAVQLNAGGTAINPGAVSSVGESTITISGPVKLSVVTEKHYDENGNLIDEEPTYTPIRGGGCSTNGGYTNVDKSTINIYAHEYMSLGVSDIMGGGCVVAGGGTGEAYTREAIINIENLASTNLERQGQGNNTTRIFGGGDMAEVRNAVINLTDCSASELRVYGGGYAEEAGRTTITGNAVININGYKMEATISDDTGNHDGNIWDKNNPQNYGIGDIVGGGYSNNLIYNDEVQVGTTSVENTIITVSGSTIRSRIFGGGYAENTGASYVGSSTVKITEGSIIEGNGASGKLDVYGGGYASWGGITQTQSSELTIDKRAIVRGQVFGGGQARNVYSIKDAKGDPIIDDEGNPIEIASDSRVNNANVVIDGGTITSAERLKGYDKQGTPIIETRAGHLSGGTMAYAGGTGGVENAKIDFKNSDLISARIFGGSSAQGEFITDNKDDVANFRTSFVNDGTVSVHIQSGTIKPDSTLKRRHIHGGGEATNGSTSIIENTNLHISGGTIQNNIWNGSYASDEKLPTALQGQEKAIAIVKNANTLLDGGTITMEFSNKNLNISAGGWSDYGGWSLVENGTLTIDGSKKLAINKGKAGDTKGIRIFVGGLAESPTDIGNDASITWPTVSYDWNNASLTNPNTSMGQYAVAGVKNGKVTIKNITLSDADVFTGGLADSAYSFVEKSEIELDNALVKSIKSYQTGQFTEGQKKYNPGIAEVGESTIVLKNNASILGNNGIDINVDANKSVIAVDQSIIDGTDAKGNALTGANKLSGISVRANERVLRLLDGVATFDFKMLMAPEKDDTNRWNYQASRPGNDSISSKLTRLEVMGESAISGNTAGMTSSLGGTGIAKADGMTIDNTLTLAAGTLEAASISTDRSKTPTLLLDTNGKLVVDGGSLKTSSDQIFNEGLGSNGKQNETKGINNDFSGKLAFHSGSLVLTDKKYNQAYANDALATIRSTAEGSTATVVMLGRLKTNSDGNGNASIDSSNNGNGDNGNHGSLDVEIKNGNGNGDGNHVHVHIKDRNTLGLIGDENSLINAYYVDENETEEDKKEKDTIAASYTVTVGGSATSAAVMLLDADASEASATNTATLNLGNVHVESKGELKGTIDVTDSGKLNVSENGKYIVTNVNVAGEANINGKLDTELTATGGDIQVSGELNGKLDATGSNLEVSGKLTASILNATDGVMDVSGTVTASSMDAAGSNITVAENGSIKTEGKLKAGGATATITVAENASVESGTLEVSGKLDISGELTSATTSACATTMNIDGTVSAGVLTADADTVINVGNGSQAGSLTVAEGSDLGGAGVFLDPIFDEDNPANNVIENASKAAFGGTTVSGRLTAGQNSLLVLGDTDTQAAMDAFKASNRSWYNEVTAAIAIMKPQTITATGSLLADGELTSASTEKFAEKGTAVFGKDSMLIVDAENAASGGDTALMGSGGQLIVEEGAKIYLHGAQENKNYSVISGFKTTDASGETTVKGWSEEDLVVNRKLTADFTFDASGNLGIATEKADINLLYPGLIAKNAMSAFEDKSDSAFMGQRFLSLATNPTLLSDNEFVDTVNEVTRASVTAGVQNTALRIADAASNTVLDHMSLAANTASVHADGVDFWAAPMYGNLYTSGMVTAGNSVRGQFGGLALGADVEAANVLGGKFRLGAAINGGGGQSETKGGATSTQNDYDFGGFNLYAGWNKGAFNAMASVGYAFGNHDVEMGLPSALGMGNAKADIDTSAITADLRAEYQLKTDWVDVLPHVGVRYTALRTDSHDLKVNGSVLNSLEADTQHIVQFPVGVTLSKDFSFADWTVKPSADISFIPAVGDKDMSSKVRFSGVDAVDSFDARVMDSSSWAATLGVQAEKGKLTFGLNYGVQASSHETDQNVQVKLGWKF